MNAVEIEEAVSELVRQPFTADEFPYAFLQAFGRKDVELKRLRKNNTSDVPGGVLRRDSIHMAVAAPGETGAALQALRDSPKSVANRVKFLLATDGDEVQAEEIGTGEFQSFQLTELDRKFGFFLPLAGISAVRQIKDNPIDVRAVGRLNKLYLELLRENPEWEEEAKRPELNRLMARLVFCFFAEDTGIFFGASLFTSIVRQFSDDRSGITNTDQVLAQLFLAMATPTQHDGKPDARYRQRAGVKGYADALPYVNGGLFSDAGEVPRFTRAARNYLLHAGELDWKEINPDIFGSMIQAVADSTERGSLGMHYTSVPNILKVLNPLFLDSLNEALAEAGSSVRKLRALRRRIGRIRVFDPACGSGNFLVIAYRQMRDIEHEIVKLTGDDPKSLIPLTNFYGIEIKGFAAEIARLALLIAEFQADARLISQQAARSMVLPLHRTGEIHAGNALQMDWTAVCPPAEATSEEWDLGGPTGRLALDEGGLNGAGGAETYICGNPPYLGKGKKSPSQQKDMERIFKGRVSSWGYIDYVSSWILLASDYIKHVGGSAALVTTNSVCQGKQLPAFWPVILNENLEIAFAHTSFKWQNNAAYNAGVSCVIVGLARKDQKVEKRLYSDGQLIRANHINAYLVSGPDVYVEPASTPLSSDIARMYTGNMPYDGGHLLLDAQELRALANDPNAIRFVRRIVGSDELINGLERWCLWIEDSEANDALLSPNIAERIDKVRALRSASPDAGARAMAATPYRFREMNSADAWTIAMPRVSSETRPFLQATLLPKSYVVTDLAYALFDAPLWQMSVALSKIHLVWASLVCGKLETRIRYSNTLGWNTFPIPNLTGQDKVDLTRCAEDIILARESHFPATLADLYDPSDMPDNLRRAHDRNDETLERIYIGRRFRNDTERLEHLFALYTKMIAHDAEPAKRRASKLARKTRSSEKTV